MSETAQNVETVELSDGPEYRVLANLFGVLIGVAGLLVGTMFRERSFDYWMEDLVPLLILMVTGRGLLKSSIELAREAMEDADRRKTIQAFLAKQHEVLEEMESVQGLQPPPQLSAPPRQQGYSEEEVLEAVAKRIEEQKNKAMKSNKFAG